MSKVKKILNWRLIPVLGWMLVIFLFSSQNGEESGASSDLLTDWFVKIIGFWYNNLTDTEQLCWYGRFSLMIRKCAHMTEYGILAVFVANWLRFRMCKHTWSMWLFTLVVTIIYAASDEFHQTFVSDRSGNFLDVFVDFCGMIIGLSLLTFWLCARKRKKQKSDFAEIHNEE